jgi:hypothetical protein
VDVSNVDIVEVGDDFSIMGIIVVLQVFGCAFLNDVGDGKDVVSDLCGEMFQHTGMNISDSIDYFLVLG